MSLPYAGAENLTARFRAAAPISMHIAYPMRVAHRHPMPLARQACITELGNMHIDSSSLAAGAFVSVEVSTMEYMRWVIRQYHPSPWSPQCACWQRFHKYHATTFALLPSLLLPPRHVPSAGRTRVCSPRALLLHGCLPLQTSQSQRGVAWRGVAWRGVAWRLFVLRRYFLESNASPHLILGYGYWICDDPMTSVWALHPLQPATHSLPPLDQRGWALRCDHSVLSQCRAAPQINSGLHRPMSHPICPSIFLINAPFLNVLDPLSHSWGFRPCRAKPGASSVLTMAQTTEAWTPTCLPKPDPRDSTLICHRRFEPLDFALTASPVLNPISLFPWPWPWPWP